MQTTASSSSRDGDFPAVGLNTSTWPLDLCIWLLISFFFFADTLSGVLAGAAGGPAPLSQAWKGLLLALIFLRSLRSPPVMALFIITFLALLLSGPILRLFLAGVSDTFIREAGAALKVLLPLAILTWCNEQRTSAPDLLQVWPRRALWLGVVALVLNIGLGLAGLGYTSYGTQARGGIGVIGFFQAGNEVGAAFAVLCGFVLMEVWNRRRWTYWPVVGLAIAMAFVIATKSAILSACLLSILIPIVYQRGRQRISIGTLFGLCLLCGLLVVAALEIWTVIETAGLAHRIETVYEQRGWFGVLLSGRNDYLHGVFDVLWADATPVEVLFGIGPEALAQFGAYESVEMDPFDLYLWFGVPGLIYTLTLATVFLRIGFRGYRTASNASGPAVLLTNFILLALSVIAGHVLLGGMASIVWAAFNAVAMGDQQAALSRTSHLRS